MLSDLSNNIEIFKKKRSSSKSIFRREYLNKRAIF